nr:G protein-coupled receptor [Proales similis]
MAFAIYLSVAVQALLLLRAQSTGTQKYVLDDCSLELRSFGDNYLAKIELELINQTAEACKSKSVGLLYYRVGKFGPKGESLPDLNKCVSTLLASIASFGFTSIYISEVSGLSVDFMIPDFGFSSILLISFSLFDFTVLDREGRAVNNCSSDLRQFAPLRKQKILLLFFTLGIRYGESVCPHIFSHAFIDGVSFFDLVDSTVKYNMLRFQATNQTLNGTMSNIGLRGYALRFDSAFFSLAIFNQTVTVQLCGLVKTFHSASLKHSSVTKIDLATSRLRELLHNNPNWLNDVNHRATALTLLVDINEPKDLTLADMSSNMVSYLTWIEVKEAPSPFDDQSFCIFYQIERYSLNVKLQGFVLSRLAEKSCTCVLFWIVTRYLASRQGNYSNMGRCYQDRAELSERCDFEKMAQRCSIETIEPFNYRTIYDTILDLEFFKYVADVWLMPVTSVLGVIANYLVIKTFRRIKRSPEYRRTKLTDKGRYMWEYTYYNSWFMLFHSLVFACTPLTTCIEYNGIYCPQWAISKFSQAFYLFVQSFFGNAFRLAANISSTLFVLYRFGLNTEALERFRKAKPSSLVVFCLVPSFIISLVTLFVNERFSVSILSKYLYDYLFTKFEYFDGGFVPKLAYLINIFLGTSFFTIVSITIDLRLLFLLRKKSTLTSKEEAENRITKMVILSGLFSFFFRLPEMISATLLTVFTISPSFFPICFVAQSRFHSLCPILLDLSRLLLAVSYLENLFLLYLFNPNFRKYFAILG